MVQHLVHLDIVVDTHLLKDNRLQLIEDIQIVEDSQIEVDNQIVDSLDLKLAVDSQTAHSRAVENLAVESLVVDIHNLVVVVVDLFIT